FPEDEGLGVRVVDPEDPDSLLCPEEGDLEQLGPQPTPGGGREIEGVDVLVLLGRVLRVLDAPVGAVPEPFRVLLDVGMVRGALEGQVESDLEAVLPGPLDQPPEAGQGAELGMDLEVATLFGPDGPGAAGVLRARLAAVVPPR